MANNPYPNKVQKSDGTTLLDITDTTAIASDVLIGKYLYLASGQKVQGSLPIIQGSFTTSSSSGVNTIDLPYSGNGYPIAFLLWIDGGSTYDTSTKRYAIVSAYGMKNKMAMAMTYDGTTGNDTFTIQCTYKGLSGTTFSTGGNSVTKIGHQDNPSASTSLFVSITEKNVIKFFTMASSYGLYPGKKYNYIVFYSS